MSCSVGAQSESNLDVVKNVCSFFGRSPLATEKYPKQLHAKIQKGDD